MMFKNDVSLCKLDINVKNRTDLVVSASLNLSRNSLRKKFYFIACSTLKIKCGKSKVCKKKYLSWMYGVDADQ